MNDNHFDHINQQLHHMLMYLMLINVFYFWVDTLQNLVPSIGSYKISSLFFYLLLYAWMLPSVIPYVVERIRPQVIVYIVFWMIAVLISTLRIDASWGLRYKNYGIWLAGAGVASFVVITYVDFDALEIYNYKNQLRLISAFTFAVFILSRTGTKSFFDPSYYMFFSSGAAVITVIEFVLYFEEKEKIDLLLSILLSLSVLIGGARGNFVQIAGAIVLYLYVRKKYALMTVGILISAVVYYLILKYAYVLGQFQFIGNSRTLRILLSGQISNLSGRSDYYARAMSYFSERSLAERLFGLGIGGERRFVVQNLNEVGYVHNIFLEIILQFGYISGTLLILIICILTGWGIHYIRKDRNCEIIGITLLSGIIPLLFSGSYITSAFFHLWMGFCLKAIMELRDEKLIQE